MQDTPSYDRNVIETFAATLLKRARNIVALCSTGGAVAGVYLGFKAFDSDNPGTLGVGLFFFFALTAVGVGIGQQLAFGARLQAHTALCQVAIERHLARIAQSDPGTPKT